MKNNKGITLIALVITIIVLLILAGVSIALLTGENGILNKATGSKSTTIAANAEDKINLTLNAIKTEIYAQQVKKSSWEPLDSGAINTKDANGTANNPITTIITKDLGSSVSTTEPAATEEGYWYKLDGNKLTISYKNNPQKVDTLSGSIELTSTNSYKIEKAEV